MSTRKPLGINTSGISSFFEGAGLTTPRGVQTQLDAMKNLAKSGNVLDAVSAFAAGKKMTNTQAAMRIQIAYRRYIEKKSRDTTWAATNMQSAWKGKQDRDKARVLRAIVRIQSNWRGNVARVQVKYSKKAQQPSKNKRQFSFRKAPKAKINHPKYEVKASEVAKPIKRSNSFSMGSRNKATPNASPSQGASGNSDNNAKTLVFVFLQKGPQGLGMELDACNTVLKVIPGGPVAKEGKIMVGDVIASVDGRPLPGLLLQDSLDESRTCYSFDIWRFAKGTARNGAVGAPSHKPARRTLSWDRRKR